MASNSMSSNIPVRLEEETFFIRSWERYKASNPMNSNTFWKNEEEKLLKSALATIEASNSMRSQDSWTIAEVNLFQREFVRCIHQDLPDILHNVAREVGNKSDEQIRRSCETRFEPYLRAWARYRAFNPISSDVSWTSEEHKLLDRSLGKYGEDMPDRWDNIAKEVGSKSVEEVRRYYEIQVRNMNFRNSYFAELFGNNH